jgi:hypothetical protein
LGWSASHCKGFFYFLFYFFISSSFLENIVYSSL